MEVEAETLGTKISQLRRDRGLTLRDVVARAGRAVSIGYVSHIEHDAAFPGRDKLQAIADVLDPEGHEQLMFDRDRGELEGLGYDSDVAELAASAAEIDPELRALLAELAKAVAALDEAAKQELADGINRLRDAALALAPSEDIELEPAARGR